MSIRAMVFLLSVLLPGQSMATWSEALKEHVLKADLPHQDTFVSTMMSYCHREIPELRLSKVQREEFFYHGPHLARPLPIKVFLKKQRHLIFNYTVAAPVAIYFPGSFNGAQSPDAKMFISSASRHRHVVVLPNPMGPEFIEAGPSYRSGHFLEEAQTLYRATREVILSLKERELIGGPISLVGGSAGGFMAAIVATLDSPLGEGHHESIIDGGTTLISPPLDYGKSIERIDELITWAHEASQESSMVELYLRSVQVCRGLGQDSEQGHWAKVLTLLFGFQWKLLKSLDTFLEVTGMEGPSEQMREGFLFRDYFDLYAQGLKHLYSSPESQLLTWVNRTTWAQKEIKVFTSLDDWINDSQDLEFFPPQSVLTIRRGGHFGFFYTRWFGEFIQKLVQY